MRAGIDSLTRLATQAAGHPPREGEAFLFTGKKRTRMKLLMWDRHGVWLVSKRLARTVLIFTESSDQLSRATDRVPGLPASPGYAQ
ncbi:IS66 family insertion sequence element accessory protein TnpB [Escherichia coli]|uniref:IS66 family insertion sequence element accessory protein TnpB n=1 Tax=Escherichia coli TaxID=562 RepID=UPI00201F2E77|nr:IS66 family insertion sequence element accessory protein TnpB [Escherichia coli]